ncbi:MAG: hypothetical protein U5J64_09310 [Halobacteriales archaeon]|nr:hypothetical protein [Halobacteriales archaeon]
MRRNEDESHVAVTRTVGLLVLISFLLFVAAGVALFAYELVMRILG